MRLTDRCGAAQYYVIQVDAPKIASVSPKHVCLSQGKRNITLTGSGFFMYNEFKPTVSVGNSTPAEADVAGAGTDLGIWRQDVLTFTTVTAQLALTTSEISKPAVTFAQPVPQVDSAHFASQIPKFVESGCTAESAELVVLPPPTVAFVQPRLMCLGSKQSVVIGGRHIVFLTTAAPAAATTTAAAATTTAAATTAPADTTTTVAPDTTTVAPTVRKRQDTTIAETTTAAADTTTAAAVTGAPSAAVTLATVGTGMETAGPGSALLGAGAATNLLGTECESTPLSGDLKLCKQATLTIDVTSSGVAAGKNASFVLTNPDPIGCASEKIDVAIIEPAKIVDMTPMLIFAENFPVPVKLTGSGFLRLDGQVPRVRFQPTVLKADEQKPDSTAVPLGSNILVEGLNVTLAGCALIAGFGDVESCTELTFVVPSGNVHTGVVDLVVTQPQPLDFMCGAARQTALLTSVGVTLTSNQPFLACASRGAQFSINGFFVAVDDRPPFLTFNGVPMDVDVLSSTSAGRLVVNTNIVSLFSAISVSASDAVLGDTPLAFVTTNALIDLNATHPGLFQPNLAPTPAAVTFIPNMQTLAPVFPGLCGSSLIEFKGDWFVRNGPTGAPPQLELVNSAGVTAAPGTYTAVMGDCVSASLPAPYAAYQKCKSVNVTVPSSGAEGFQLRLRARGVLDKCALTVDQPIKAVMANQISLTSVAPNAICIGQGGEKLTLIGSFPLIGAALPNVALNGVAFGGATCAKAPTTPGICNEMTLPIDPTVAQNSALLLQGDISAVVRVSASCQSAVVAGQTRGSPTAAAARLTPDRVCGSQNVALDVSGSSIINVANAVELELTATGKPPYVVALTNVANCTGAAPNTVCQSARASLVGADLEKLLSTDNSEVAVRYALVTSRKCTQAPHERVLTIVPPPTVNANNGVRLTPKVGAMSTAPSIGCLDQAYTLTINGQRFVTTKKLRVELRPMAGGSTVTFQDGDAGVTVGPAVIQIELAAGFLPVGSYAVVVNNGGLCESAPQTITIDPVVRVVTTEPSALPLALANDVPFTLRTVGVSRPNNLAITAPGASFSNPLLIDDAVQLKFNGASAAGTFPFTVRTEAFCTGSSAAPIFEILPDSARVPVTTDTPVLYTGEVVVRGAAGTTFSPGTRLYVRRTAGIEELGETHVIEGATAVRGLDKVESNGVLEYFVVDPVNKKWGQFQITKTSNQNAANVVLPSTVVAGTGSQTLTVRAISQADVTNLSACQILCLSLQNAARNVTCTLGAIVNSGAGDLVSVSVDRSLLQVGDVCRVRFLAGSLALSSNALLTSQRFAVVPETNTFALNTSFSVQPTALRNARRGACAAAAETVPRRGAQPRTYVHVMGGFDAANAAQRSTEVALVSDVTSTLTFGVGSQLVTAVAECAAATLNGVVYAIGGGQLQKAKILSADDAPLLTAKVQYASGQLAAGVYSYAVSYTTTMDGESLPSNFAEVVVAANATVELKFSAATTGITQWTVYRGVPGQPLRQIATPASSAVSYNDVGVAASGTAASPLSPGAVSRWTGSAFTPNSRNAIAFTNVAFGNAMASSIVYAGGFSGSTSTPTTTVTRISSSITALQSLNVTMAKHVFVRLQDGFGALDGVETELWALFTDSEAWSGVQNANNAVFDKDIKPAAGMYTVQLGSCGAAGGGKVYFVGGGDNDVRVASFSRNAQNFAQMGATSTTPATGLPRHDEPACVRVAGKLLLIGGVSSAASTTVTQFVL